MERAREPAMEQAMEQTNLLAISQSKFGFANSNHIIVYQLYNYNLTDKGILSANTIQNIARMVSRF